jgi:branched-chain amino acid transport system permease protein
MEQKTIRVKGTQMCYLQQGEGVPVLLIHGNTGCNLWFEKVMDMPGIAAWAPDLPNFGCSENIKEIDIDVYADYAKAFSDAVGLEKPVVVGHSFGGAVAMSAVLRNPGWARSMMLVDAAPADGLPTPEAHYPIIEQYKENRDLMKQALGALMPEVPDQDHFERLVDKGMEMNPDAYVGHAKVLTDFDYVASAGKHDGTVLVVVGDKDPLITVDSAKKTASQFPTATLQVVEGVGHAVMVERPEEFVAITRKFSGVE